MYIINMNEVEIDPFAGFDQFVTSNSLDVTSKSKLDFYLEESVLPRVPTFDILGWWKTHGVKYPNLQKMAKDIPTIPISNVASEFAFSMCRRLISPHRYRLHHNTLEVLMCARTWLWNEVNGKYKFQFLILK